MSEIIDQFYTPLLTEHGFVRDPDNQQYGSLGVCWKLSPEVGEGTYWTYGQKDLYDIKIHNFSFHEDFMLECSLPECLSITRYDSISGEELSPYRRLSAGCIKTFIGGYAPYKALIHKHIGGCRTTCQDIALCFFLQPRINLQKGHYRAKSSLLLKSAVTGIDTAKTCKYTSGHQKLHTHAGSSLGNI